MNRRVTLVLAVVAVLLLPVLGMVVREDGSSSQQPTTLQRPPFVDVAHADETTPTTIGEKLDQEAGISAYYQTPGPITLSLVRSAFRTIEDETADYIIGSVPFPDNPELFDVHAYVHKDGWIVAYYLKADPASKIVDVKNGTVESDKLESTISTIAGLAGAPFSGVDYYDFRFPNATHMMIIGEDTLNGSDFTVELPSEFGYYERSWLLYDVNIPGFLVDGTDYLDDGVDAGGYLYFGLLNAAQLSPDVAHQIDIDAINGGHTSPYGALVIIYNQP